MLCYLLKLKEKELVKVISPEQLIKSVSLRCKWPSSWCCFLATILICIPTPIDNIHPVAVGVSAMPHLVRILS